MMRLLREIRDSLPGDFGDLLTDSLKDGHQFLQRLQADWLSGANRFSKPGERLLAAIVQDRLVGIGGINIDPYLNDVAKGRVRHLYIHTSCRRQGVAMALVEDLENGAAHYFDVLTLRTNTPQADLFYHAAGFTKVQDNASVTHQKALTLPRTARGYAT